MAMAVMAVGAVLSVKSSMDAASAARDQANAQKASNAYQQKIADVQAMRERRQTVRQAYLNSGTIINAGANSGVLTSSGASGALSSVSSQMGSNLSFLDEVQGYAQQATIFNQKAADAASSAASSNAMAGLWGSVSSMAGQWGGNAAMAKVIGS